MLPLIEYGMRLNIPREIEHICKDPCYYRGDHAPPDLACNWCKKKIKYAEYYFTNKMHTLCWNCYETVPFYSKVADVSFI